MGIGEDNMNRLIILGYVKNSIKYIYYILIYVYRNHLTVYDTDENNNLF